MLVLRHCTPQLQLGPGVRATVFPDTFAALSWPRTCEMLFSTRIINSSTQKEVPQDACYANVNVAALSEHTSLVLRSLYGPQVSLTSTSVALCLAY